MHSKLVCRLQCFLLIMSACHVSYVKYMLALVYLRLHIYMCVSLCCMCVYTFVCNNFKGLCNVNVAGQEAAFQGDIQTEVSEGETGR